MREPSDTDKYILSRNIATASQNGIKVSTKEIKSAIKEMPMASSMRDVVINLVQQQSSEEGAQQQQHQPSVKSSIRKLHNFVYGIYFGEGSMNGEGTLLIRNGEIYKGTFVNSAVKSNCNNMVDNNERKGTLVKGTYIGKGIVYIGSFENYEKNGEAYQFPLGPERQNDTFVGTFKDGKRNGSGIHYQRDRHDKGKWVNGMKFGEFIVQFGSNTANQAKEYYHNDQRVAGLSSQQPKITPFEKTIEGYKIDNKNLKTLEEKKCISPTVLSAYYCLLSNEYRRMASLLRRPCKRVKILNEVIGGLVGQSFNEEDINSMRNSRANMECPGSNSKYTLPVFDYYDVLLFPIQVYHEHFVLVQVRVARTMVETDKKWQYSFSIGYMDSLRYEAQTPIEKTIKKYLINELDKNKYMQEQEKRQITETIEETKLKRPQDYQLPEQPNGYNCGVWVATYIKNILRELLTGQATDWSIVSESQVSNMRTEIVDCLKFEAARIF